VGKYEAAGSKLNAANIQLISRLQGVKELTLDYLFLVTSGVCTFLLAGRNNTGQRNITSSSKGHYCLFDQCNLTSMIMRALILSQKY
jgi:hypothetical protein